MFEKLLKNRLSNTLQENISKFQNGGMKGKGVVDNLFIIRGIINHAKYQGKELWLTFYLTRGLADQRQVIKCKKRKCYTVVRCCQTRFHHQRQREATLIEEAMLLPVDLRGSVCFRTMSFDKFTMGQNYFFTFKPELSCWSWST